MGEGMRYRRLGKTGLEVSEISFGTGDNAGLMMNAPEAERLRSFERALELGINYFDTSPDYGKGRAEENLGAALKTFQGRTTKPLYVCTKIEIMPEDFGDIAGKIVRSTEASLKRLQLDCIDVLMIHNPPRLSRNPEAAFWRPMTPEDFLGPGLEGLEKMRAAGKARFTGFTCENSEPAAVKPLLSTGHFDAINCWYNMVNPTAGIVMPSGVKYGPTYDNYDGIITHAGACDVGVAVIRPLSGGALTPQALDAGEHGRHPFAGGMYTRNPASFRPETLRGRAFGFLHKPPRTLPVAGYQFALSHNSVSTVVGGFSDFAQLEETVAAASFPPLSAEEMQQVQAVYARNFDLD